MPCQYRRQCDLDGCDIAVTAHFGHEPASRLENSFDARDHGVLIANPVQCGIGEDRMEGVSRIRESFGIAYSRCDSAGPCTLYHFCRSIQAYYACACSRDSLCQLAIAATQIQDVFTWFWSKPLKNTCAETGDKGAIFCIDRWIPALNHCVSLGGFSARSAHKAKLFYFVF